MVGGFIKPVLRCDHGDAIPLQSSASTGNIISGGHTHMYVSCASEGWELDAFSVAVLDLAAG